MTDSWGTPQPSSKAMAEWMFDHGYGYADQPRFRLADIDFYPADYLPDRTDILERKIALAQAQNETDIQDGTKSFFQISPKHFAFDTAKAEKLFEDIDSAGNAQPKAVKDVLNRIKEKQYHPFTQDAIKHAASMQAIHRTYFIHFIQDMAADAVEYALRAKIPIHLNRYYEDSTDRTEVRDKFNEKTQTYCFELMYGTALPGDPTDITVGALDENHNFASYVFYHELGHDIFFPDFMKSGRLSAECCLAKIEYLESTQPKDAPPLPVLDDAMSIYGIKLPNELEKIISREVLQPKYPKPMATESEICTRLLALSFGTLEGDAGAALLREHYADYPEYAEAVIELRDEVRSIFDKRLALLRVKNPLPPELTGRTMNR